MPSIVSPTAMYMQGAVEVNSLDDHDVPPKPPLKPSWVKLRLSILLMILVPLSIFGYFQNRYTTAQLKISKALTNWDNRQAVLEIKELEKRTGLTSETAFLRSRAYRHLGDDIAFAQFSEIAKQLGYPDAKLQSEKLLREIQLGNVPDIESSLATSMAAPDAELSEIGPAVIYGLLGRLDFGGVNQFLAFWSEQEPQSPWLPFFQGMLQIANRDTAASIESFEACVRENPDFIPVYAQLGAAYSKARDFENAITATRRYLESNPADLESVAVLANSLVSLDRGDEVVALLLPLIESGRATVDMKLILGRVYIAREQWTNVVDTLSSVAAVWPEDVRTANLLSQAHQALGNEAEAERFATIAEAGQPDVQSIDQRVSRLLGGVDNTAEKHYELGHILLHKQSREEGLQWLSSALAVDETYLPAHEDLVIYFNRTNQPELAARHQRYINRRRGTQ